MENKSDTFYESYKIMTRLIGIPVTNLMISKCHGLAAFFLELITHANTEEDMPKTIFSDMKPLMHSVLLRRMPAQEFVEQILPQLRLCVPRDWIKDFYKDLAAFHLGWDNEWMAQMTANPDSPIFTLKSQEVFVKSSGFF